MVWTLNPWQTLLWIVALEVVSLPLIVAAISSIIDRYYRSKEAHSARIMKAIANTIDEVTKKIKEDGKKIKNKLCNPFSSSFTIEDIERAFDEIGYKKKSTVTMSEDKDDDDKEE